LLAGCATDPQEILPDFRIMLPDGGRILHTKNIVGEGPVMLIHFDSDCRECQEEAEALKAQRKALSHVEMYYLSVQEFEDILLFQDYFDLGEYANIHFGRDVDTTMAKHFKTPTTPLIALYDQHRQLRAVFEG